MSQQTVQSETTVATQPVTAPAMVANPFKKKDGKIANTPKQQKTENIEYPRLVEGDYPVQIRGYNLSVGTEWGADEVNYWQCDIDYAIWLSPIVQKNLLNQIGQEQFNLLNIDESGFKEFSRKFYKFELKGRYLRKDGIEGKAGYFTRVLDAALMPFGIYIDDEVVDEYLTKENEELFHNGEYPVWRELYKKEADAKRQELGIGKDAQIPNEHKFIQTEDVIDLFTGYLSDIKINGYSTVGGWVKAEVTYNKKGYPQIRDAAVTPLDLNNYSALAAAGLLNQPYMDAMESGFPAIAPLSATSANKAQNQAPESTQQLPD